MLWREVYMEKSKIGKIVTIVFIVLITKITTSFGMQNYYNVDFSTGLVTASALNVRSGPRNKLSCNCKSV